MRSTKLTVVTGAKAEGTELTEHTEVTGLTELMKTANLMQEPVTLRRMAKPLTIVVLPMQEAVTLRVLQWPLTEVALH